MQGKNEMQLNQATMIKAVEHYFNCEVLSSFHQISVISIAQNQSEGAESRTFRIIFEPRSKPEAEDD